MSFTSIIYLLIFLAISFILIVSALGVIFARSIVISAVSLILTFLSVAGIFILLNADFVAISQVIIYGVGITIVLLFAIMLTSKESDIKLWIAKAPRTLFGFLITAALFGIVVFSITNGLQGKSEKIKIFNIKPPTVETIKELRNEGTSRLIGKGLFTNYILPFEVLSLLLLSAILGSVVIARKDNDKLKNPTTTKEDC